MIKKRRVLPIMMIAILAAILLLLWQFSPPPHYPDLPAHFHAERAIWMDITWVMDDHTDEEIDALAQMLQGYGVDYVFAYVSYLKAGDVFNPTYDYAAHFTERFRSVAPEIRLLAWVGVPINIGAGNRLENPAIRALIADFANTTITEMGFDGFHLNAEPAANDDPALIETLQAIRGILPEGAMLSITAHALRLSRFVTLSPYPTQAHHWTPDYLRLVAQNVDQIALMAYDSGLVTASDYRAWMAYQVEMSAEALGDLPINFLIGVPTSEEWTSSHQLTAEYLRNALYGVRVGLARSSMPENVDGIAIYPDWETDSAEWGFIDAAFPNESRQPDG